MKIFQIQFYSYPSFVLLRSLTSILSNLLSKYNSVKQMDSWVEWFLVKGKSDFCVTKVIPKI